MTVSCPLDIKSHTAHCSEAKAFIPDGSASSLKACGRYTCSKCSSSSHNHFSFFAISSSFPSFFAVEDLSLWLCLIPCLLHKRSCWASCWETCPDMNHCWTDSPWQRERERERDLSLSGSAPLAGMSSCSYS